MWAICDFLFPAPSHFSPEELLAESAQGISERKEVLKKRGLKHIDAIHAAVMYDEAPRVRCAVRQLKYYRARGLSMPLAQLMHHALLSHFDSAQCDKSNDAQCDSNIALCPVPLHWTRQFQRGFNQSELLAHDLGQLRSLPIEILLKRRRPTGHQAWRKRAERLTAVQNAFRVCSENLPVHVILIDDLSTTGSTLDACAKALKEGGVSRVEAWVIALA